MRLLTWIAGLVGFASLARWLRRRRRRHVGSPAAELASNPALELRRKLDEARTGPDSQISVRTDEEQEPVPSRPSPAAAEPLDQSLSLEERRSRVHVKAREAIDLMQTDDS